LNNTAQFSRSQTPIKLPVTKNNKTEHYIPVLGEIVTFH